MPKPPVGSNIPQTSDRVKELREELKACLNDGDWTITPEGSQLAFKATNAKRCPTLVAILTEAHQTGCIKDIFQMPGTGPYTSTNVTYDMAQTVRLRMQDQSQVGALLSKVLQLSQNQ